MPSSASFRLPKDGPIYTEAIYNRCRDLIRYDVWSGIEPHRLDMWIGNFRGQTERYFGARVLDALIYRSDKQTVALMRQLFHRVIPDLARRRGLDQCMQTLYYSLQRHDLDPNVRIVPVIPPDAPPTKSGSTIARILRRNLRFRNQWFLHPNEIIDSIATVKAFVFVDDFLGTGDQFSTFLQNTGLDSRLSGACFIYAPLVGHAKGLSNLFGDHPDLNVGTVELLNEAHALFNQDAGGFPDELNSADTARDFYYTLLADRKIEIYGPDRRGFGHLEVAYAFEHAVPDNSLPILWWEESEHWRPLFLR
jgi:hypothetical protein